MWPALRDATWDFVFSPLKTESLSDTQSLFAGRLKASCKQEPGKEKKQACQGSFLARLWALGSACGSPLHHHFTEDDEGAETEPTPEGGGLGVA